MICSMAKWSLNKLITLHLLFKIFLILNLFNIIKRTFSLDLWVGLVSGDTLVFKFPSNDIKFLNDFATIQNTNLGP